MQLPSFFYKSYIQIGMIILIVIFVLAGLPKHQLFSLQGSVQSVFQSQDISGLRAQEGLTTLVTGTLPPDTSCSGTSFYCSGDKNSVYKGTSKLVVRTTSLGIGFSSFDDSLVITISSYIIKFTICFTIGHFIFKFFLSIWPILNFGIICPSI